MATKSKGKASVSALAQQLVAGTNKHFANTAQVSSRGARLRRRRSRRSFKRSSTCEATWTPPRPRPRPRSLPKRPTWRRCASSWMRS